ncbi:hypothetical protein A2U01_0059171, partial [Trifolium medium]|nr:hypothetical protein [Trifolium medium]
MAEVVTSNRAVTYDFIVHFGIVTFDIWYGRRNPV